jgi:hypothetical protein
MLVEVISLIIQSQISGSQLLLVLLSLGPIRQGYLLELGTDILFDWKTGFNCYYQEVCILCLLAFFITRRSSFSYLRKSFSEFAPLFIESSGISRYKY